MTPAVISLGVVSVVTLKRVTVLRREKRGPHAYDGCSREQGAKTAVPISRTRFSAEKKTWTFAGYSGVSTYRHNRDLRAPTGIREQNCGQLRVAHSLEAS